ncbi:pentatricopeptide repeat-containing protein At3g20730 isoform X1 [Zingiber officinale]|uniref:pentatricopeptide repeat-containing protein At3g20730 isoform X1 n=2 Tax=Zingiber officinale TaxID=94328 RepID=UPI001C4AD125|nr:pentatricopeptide repeat-containing protein At3g20730 isoform X1 [Zingiber officinale]
MNAFLNRNFGLPVMASFRRLSLLSCSNPSHSSSPWASSEDEELCTDSCGSDNGLTLHDHLIPVRRDADLHTGRKFIMFHAQVGNLTMARRLFDKMPYRNVVIWTALISGYARCGQAMEALELFSLMRSSGFSGNQFTYGSVLRACTSLGFISNGQQIHGCITKSRFEDNLIVQTALINMHLKCGSVADAGHLFARMEKKDVVTWNSMIGGCAVRGLRDDAFKIFGSMIREGVRPDQFTFANILRACSAARVQLHVDQIHASIIKLGLESHAMLSGPLIDAYAKCKNLDEATKLYNSIVDRDLISATALITGYASDNRFCRKSMDIFHQINRMGNRIDKVMICAMFNVCANAPDLNFGRQIHAYMRKIHFDFDYDTALGNALIDMYAKSGELHDASSAFEEMREKDVISWTSLITGYGKNGCGENAVKLFSKMEANEVKPNGVTFLALIFSCSHSGLVIKGLEYLNLMVKKYHIKPREEHYSCIVDLLARGGLLKEAYDLVYKMDIKPNASLWGAVLGACSLYGHTSLGEVAGGYLLTLFPERSVNYVVLANIYTAAGLWDSAWRTRKMMEDRSEKKDSGYTYI